MNTHSKTNRGGSSILAVFFVSLFSVLAVSFAAVSNLNVQVSNNHQKVITAHAAAQSGLAYAQGLIYDYIKHGANATYYNTVTNPEAVTTFTHMANYLKGKLDGTPLVGGATTTLVNNVYTIPSVRFDTERHVSLRLVFEQNLTEPNQVQVTSVGSCATITRTVSITYTICKDTTLLKYAIASKNPVVIKGNSTIEGDILSTWRDVTDAPPIILSAASTVNGSIGTVLGEDEYPDFATHIQGTNNGIEYNQPDFEVPAFDPSVLIAELQETELNLDVGEPSKTGKKDAVEKEYFPHGSGGYDTAPANGNDYDQVHRKIYENKIYTGSVGIGDNGSYVNAVFRNCTFNGMMIIRAKNDNGVGGGTNNIRFENCTFNGPVIAGNLNHFSSRKNTLYFTGHTVFGHGYTYETTVLAPMWHVDLGNIHGNGNSGGPDLIEGVTGLVVGGVVDIRGNVYIDGSILSMFDTSTLSEAERIKHATNIGYDNDWEGTIPMVDGAIHVNPNEDRLMPSGVCTKIVLQRNSSQYVEF